VIGETKTLNGKRVKDIAEKMDAAINGFLSTVKGKFVDIKPNVQITNGEDIAFVTVIVDLEEKADKVSGDEEKPRWSKKKD
jgi:hypothetical protein